MNAALGLVVLVVSIIGYAVVNSIEIAVVGASRISVHHLAQQGSRSAQALERLQNKQERFFAAIVAMQNLLNFLVVSTGTLVAVELAGGVGYAAAFVLLPLNMTLFGELTPKVLASQASERFALFAALPAEGLTRLLSPLVWVLSGISGLFARALLGVRAQAGPSVTEAELRMLIGISAETGSVAEEEAELLDRVFHFGDRHLHEVMIPRNEAVWLEKDATIADFYQVYSQRPHSRFPVYDESPDTVVGILGIKDVLRQVAGGQVRTDSSIAPLVRPAYFVPESKLIGELFREMQASNIQMAIAVDEFGGTAGIVTLELLIEEMFGPVRDELRLQAEEIRTIDEHTLQVDGSLSVDEARDELGLDIPEGPYDTIAGYVLDRLGHIPNEGEQLTLDKLRITIAEMKGPKIELLRVTKG